MSEFRKFREVYVGFHDQMPKEIDVHIKLENIITVSEISNEMMPRNFEKCKAKCAIQISGDNRTRLLTCSVEELMKFIKQPYN